MAVGRINGFFYKEMYDRFAGSKRRGRNKGVTVLLRWL